MSATHGPHVAPRPDDPLGRALDRACHGRLIPGNAVTHLSDAAALDDMLDRIDGARRWIHLENYIIRDDRTGQAFAERLRRAAGRGVEVRVLYDWLGSRRTRSAYWRGLSAAGIQARGFNAASLFRPIDSLRRDHRKYLGVDGMDAVVGGICIGDEWAGGARRDTPPWRDTAVRISGPAVPPLEWSFLRMWEMAGGRTPTYAVPSRVDVTGTAGVRIVEGVPGRLRLYRAIELLAASAAERLWVTDAYLVVVTPLFASIRSAARDGVDVRLLVPGHTDLPAVRALTRVGYRELLHAGVRIWEWHGPMLHAKTVVVDDHAYKVGSSNLNPSSFLANYELDVLLEDATTALDAAAQFRLDLSQATEIVLRPIRAPEMLQARIPPAVVRAETPSIPLPAVRVPGERSRRAVMTLRKVAAGARRSVAGAVTFASIGTGVLFLTLPRLMAYVLAILCFTLGMTAAWQYLQRRRHWRD